MAGRQKTGGQGGQGGIIEPSSPGKHVFIYRCPACQYVVDRELLFGVGCPICGWQSPLVKAQRICNTMAGSHVDVADEGESVRVTMEMSLPEYDDLRVDISGGMLKVSSGGTERMIPLKGDIERVVERSYRNGVLEIRLKAAGKGGSHGNEERT